MKLGLKRSLLLIILLIILFVNWYYSFELPFIMQDFLEANSQSLQEFSGIFNVLGRFNMLYKWISIFILILSNIGISLTIIYVYFWNKKMVFQAVKILAAYAFSFFTLGIVFYYLGRKDLSADAIGSLNLLSTPVVECAMIPLLKLMNAKVVKEENQDN